MNKKILVGFEIIVDMSTQIFESNEFSTLVLQKLLELSNKNYMTIDVQYDKGREIRIYCNDGEQEVPLLSRGCDGISEEYTLNVYYKYRKLLSKMGTKSTWVQVNPIYFIFSRKKLMLYRPYDIGMQRIFKLEYDEIWDKYHSRHFSEIYAYMAEKVKLKKNA